MYIAILARCMGVAPQKTGEDRGRQEKTGEDRGRQGKTGEDREAHSFT
jgi:hypothetical protein